MSKHARWTHNCRVFCDELINVKCSYLNLGYLITAIVDTLLIQLTKLFHARMYTENSEQKKNEICIFIHIWGKIEWSPLRVRRMNSIAKPYGAKCVVYYYFFSFYWLNLSGRSFEKLTKFSHHFYTLGVRYIHERSVRDRNCRDIIVNKG